MPVIPTPTGWRPAPDTYGPTRDGYCDLCDTRTEVRVVTRPDGSWYSACTDAVACERHWASVTA